MYADFESDPDAFDSDFFLFFAVFALAFFPLVPELAVVHYPAHRRSDGRRDFDQIKPPLAGKPERLGSRHHSEVFSVLVNHAERRDADELVDAITALD